MIENRITEQKLSRRSVLQVGSAAAGGLLVSTVLPLPRGRAAAGSPQPLLTAWLRLAPDDSVTMMIPSAEMGQGISTSLPMLIAEELEVDWNKIRFEAAPTDPAYANPIFHMQATGGSTSIRAFYTPLRQVGAAARIMFTSAGVMNP
jgi:isoquinoline 1-oxidoreductase beta subunit